MRMTMILAIAAVAAVGCKSPTGPTGTGQAHQATVPATVEEPPPEPSAAATTTAAPASSESETVLHIDGMVCEGCANAAKGCLEGVDGVTHVDLSFQDGTARVRFDSGRTSAQALASAIEAVDRGAAPPLRVTSVEGAQ